MRDDTIHRFLRYLIGGSLLVGIVSTLSYGAQIQNLMRMVAPGAGAWWSDYQFYFMAGSATAVGLLVALRVGLRFVDPESARRGALVSLALDAVLILPLTHLCTIVARVGAHGGSVVVQNAIASFVGYTIAKRLDMLIVAGTYFLKTAAFGFLLGLGLFGAILAGVILTAHGGDGIAGAEPPRGDP